MQTGPCRLHIDPYKDFGFYSEWHGSHGQGAGGGDRRGRQERFGEE